MSATASWAGRSSMRTASPPKRCGQGDRALVAAVGDEDGVRAAGGQRPGGELGRLTGADQQYTARREVAQVALGELDGDRGDRDTLLPDGRLGAGPLARGERATEHPVEDRAGGALDQGQLVRPLHLPLDFGLADDHRVEPGGHPVEMARGLGAAQRVERARAAPWGGSPPPWRGRRGPPPRPRPSRWPPGRARCGCRSRAPRASLIVSSETRPLRTPAARPSVRASCSRSASGRGAVRDPEGEQAAHPRPPWRTASISSSRSRTCPTPRSVLRPCERSARSASDPSSRWIRWSFAAMIAT